MTLTQQFQVWPSPVRLVVLAAWGGETPGCDVLPVVGFLSALIHYGVQPDEDEDPTGIRHAALVLGPEGFLDEYHDILSSGYCYSYLSRPITCSWPPGEDQTRLLDEITNAIASAQAIHSRAASHAR